MRLVCVLLFLGLTAAFPYMEDGVADEPYPPNTHTQAPEAAKSRFAMLDDVRLLANGLLQLGQSLREFVHKTKAQINDIFQKLNIFDRSFYQLSVATSEIKEEEEELKRTTSFLKANNEEIRNLSLEINAKIEGILQERTELQSKVGSLEQRLKGLSQTVGPAGDLREIHSLKSVIESQEKTINELLNAVKEQQDQLNYQKSKIKSLEEKFSEDSTFQETADKPMNSSPETTEFLMNNCSGTSLDPTDLPVDCSELFTRGERKSGVYPIKPNQSEPFNVYCDMSPDAGFTVIQRRMDGSVDFNQTWDKYEDGFGDLESEFWLGLRKLHAIAGQRDASVLHIQLEDWKEEKQFVEYQFTLEGPASHYALHPTHLSGNLPDAMGNHTSMAFSTKDRDNDKHKDSNCARTFTGGWWFNACGDTNLNGMYVWLKSRGRTQRKKGIHWKPGKGASYWLKSTKISIKPASTLPTLQ